MPETLRADEFRLLRTIGFAGALGDVDEILGLDGRDLSALLRDLRSSGLVEDDLIALTDQGDIQLQASYDSEYDALSDDVRESMHQAFRPLDVEVKRLASAWQDAEARNDWDARLEIIEGLEELLQDLRSYLAGPAGDTPRLAEFDARLSAALEKAQSGEFPYVVGVTVDSYHTAWFHLHEDLLRILHKERDPE